MFDPDGIENLLPPAPPENSLEEKTDPEEQFELQPTDCEWRDCPVCGGTGDEEDGYSHCGNCLGTGVVHQSGSPPPAPQKSSLEGKQGA